MEFIPYLRESNAAQERGCQSLGHIFIGKPADPVPASRVLHGFNSLARGSRCLPAQTYPGCSDPVEAPACRSLREGEA